MNSAPIKTSTTILVVALCLSAADVEACGEVMLRSLQTMRYHAFVTHHPAAILLYSGDGNGSIPREQAGKLHDGLEKPDTRSPWSGDRTNWPTRWLGIRTMWWSRLPVIWSP